MGKKHKHKWEYFSDFDGLKKKCKCGFWILKKFKPPTPDKK